MAKYIVKLELTVDNVKSRTQAEKEMVKQIQLALIDLSNKKISISTINLSCKYKSGSYGLF